MNVYKNHFSQQKLKLGEAQRTRAFNLENKMKLNQRLSIEHFKKFTLSYDAMNRSSLQVLQIQRADNLQSKCKSKPTLNIDVQSKSTLCSVD